MKDVSQFNLLEDRFHGWLAQWSITGTRIALGIVFLWFGLLKFVPGLSSAEDLAERTITVLTFGLVPPSFAMPVLAAWECAIGFGLLTGLFMRTTLVLLALQLPGTFMPLLFFPTETWMLVPFAPTFEGQYIIKNVVLISAGLLLGGTMHGGRVITDPVVAREAERKQAVNYRFRKRFHREFTPPEPPARQAPPPRPEHRAPAQEDTDPRRPDSG